MKNKNKLWKERWNDNQKKAFLLIQDTIYTKLGLTNQEVADMHTLESREEVFSLFKFQTGMWLNQNPSLSKEI